MSAARPSIPGPAVAIVGTTASGKSALALQVARALPDVELVSIDSMQVYRGMDIGTASPTPAERAEVPHHLVDVADPWEDWSLARFQAAARDALADVAARGRRAVLVGGTGLYLRAVIDGLEIPGQHPEARAAVEAEPDTRALHRRLAELDPLAASRMEPDNRRRVVRALEVTLGSGRPFSSYGPGLETHPETVPQVGIRLPPAVVAARIEARYHAQLEAGFLDEVDALLALPHPLSRTAAQALGYRELIAHRRGEMTLEGALDEAVRRTRRFARRQRSWFRRDPRITWFDAAEDPDEVAEDLVAHVLVALGAGPPER
ncbi:tRNA (adenosine(37)-N6)-dimethylallyltransferase MiaA [Iamia sp. SCSIO 61187]|uniref:tRNA (adenosine(37)-N6)-dimethylallyltransferase MiaA n=1 Tax=Iamia sp. SCSIO 61187 TaxID=2722752 RepID=UPI002105F5C9|nr:tRNA (adenosine(37)-N6)-dimethylallyltransferase MiaA [Iamia sp. SCSIO 61187]QYG92675.1 tRNA (adenosine(37)-N6)-dimethylallyltransferase MiaA [Iamia sp. SCSIO 61187]